MSSGSQLKHTGMCPKCGKENTYTTASALKQAIARGTCVHCVGYTTDFVKPCPSCGKSQSFKTQYMLNKARKLNSVCRTCAHKPRVECSLKKFCSKCGREQTYTTVYSLRRAIEENTDCLKCSARQAYWTNVDHVSVSTITDLGDRNDCYVYEYIDPVTDIPFYVGKGVDDRHLAHLKERADNTDNRRKFNKIQKLLRNGALPVIRFVAENLTAQQAYEKEREEILRLGRKGYDPDGVLLNICIDARPPNQKGKKFSEAHKRKIGEALKRFLDANPAVKAERLERAREGLRRANRLRKEGKLPPLQHRANRLRKEGKLPPLQHRDFFGAKNPRAISWRVTDPQGAVFEVRGEFEKFCQDHGLAHATFIKALRIGKWPTYGKNAGWRVERITS